LVTIRPAASGSAGHPPTWVDAERPVGELAYRRGRCVAGASRSLVA